MLDEFVYSEDNDNYIKVSDAENEKIKSISGTEARKMLKNGEIPPSWYMREEISNYVIDAIKNRKEVFVK